MSLTPWGLPLIDEKSRLPRAELELGGQWRLAKEPTLFQEKIQFTTTARRPQRKQKSNGRRKSRPFYPVILCFPVVAIVVVVSSW
jgi:hypothetical protein